MILSRSRTGQSLVEVVVAVGIMSSLLAPLALLAAPSTNAAMRSRHNTIATFLAVQGLEAARMIGRASFAALVEGDYGLDDSSGSYIFDGTSDITAEGYTRVVRVECAMISGSTLVADPGCTDPNRRKITSIVSWRIGTGLPRSLTLSTYLTNWQ